jgi:AcrR family transcriptional regulator
MNKRSGINSKKRILIAALQVFSEYGYKGASMRMIASSARISIGGVYLYFTNKEELYLTLIKERFDDFSAQVKTSISEIEDPVKAISTFVISYLEYVRNHKEFILTQGREHGFAFGIDVKREFFNEQRNLIEEIIKRGMQSGVFTECNAKEATKIIMGTLRGFILSIVVDPDNLFSPEECCRLMLGGLLKRQVIE